MKPSPSLQGLAGAHWDTNTVEGLTSSVATPGIGAANLDEFTVYGNLDPNGPQQRCDR